MKRSRQWVHTAILAALLFSLCWWLYLEHIDPRYNGRRTSEWLQALRSDDAEEVKAAELAIFVLGEKAVPQISRCFFAHEPQWKTEAFDWIIDKTNWEIKREDAGDLRSMGERAVDILGKQAAPMIPRLIEGLGDDEFASTSRDAFESIGKPAAQSLKVALSHKKPEIQVAAIYLLAKLDQKDILPILWRNLDSDHSEVRGVSLVALASFGIPQVDLLPHIRKMAQDKHPEVRAEAVNLLGILAETNHTLISEFAGHVKDPSRDVRVRVAIRVWRYCHLDPSAIDALQQGLADADEKIKGISYFALLVWLHEASVHRMIWQRSFGPWWSAELLPKVPFEPLVYSSEAIYQRSARFKVILTHEAEKPLPSAAEAMNGVLTGRSETRIMASCALLLLCDVSKTKLALFENERTAALNSAYGQTLTFGFNNGIVFIPAFTNGFAKKTLSNSQWNNLNTKINDISQIDADAGKIALKMVTDYFGIPAATNSVPNP